MDVDGTIRLVGAILRGTPSLPGAACIGRSELYDSVDGQKTREVAELLAQRRTAAAALCQRCPFS